MKVALEFPVEGTVYIGSPIHVTVNDREFVMTPDVEGNLSAIRIITPVQETDRVISKAEPGDQNVHTRVTVDMPSEVYDELVEEFQELESILSFSTEGALKRLRWNAPTQDFIPETEEEEARVSVRSFKLETAYPVPVARLTKGEVVEILSSKERYRSLVIVKSFFREGENEYSDGQYINAFHNFYYVLEDLYGGGKTNNRAIAGQFKASREFREIVDWMLENLKESPRHMSSVAAMLQSETLHTTHDDVIELLVRVRGRSHHYTSKDGKRFPTPFSHRAYEGIAWLTLGIAVRSILNQIVTINRDEPGKEIIPQ